MDFLKHSALLWFLNPHLFASHQKICQCGREVEVKKFVLPSRTFKLRALVKHIILK